MLINLLFNILIDINWIPHEIERNERKENVSIIEYSACQVYLVEN